MSASLSPQAMQRFAQGFQASEILYVIAKFNFASFLQDGPKSGEELAALAKTKEEHTGRLLRAAAALGIFNRDPESLKYSLTDVSSLLLDGPKSMRNPVLHLCEPQTVKAWLHLDKTIQDGTSCYKEELGVGCFEYYAQNAESSDRFNKAMNAFSASMPVAQALHTQYGFKEVKHVVDVGGGQGILLINLLRLNPHLSGTTFDLQHVIEDAKAKKAVNYSDVESRFSYAAGSFFDSVPTGGDIYTIKSVICDWGDSKAIEILKTVRNALPENGKVVVVDRIVRETDDAMGAIFDIHMLVMLDSKGRNENEFRHIFEAAGLRLTRFIPLPPTSFYAIEGEKIV